MQQIQQQSTDGRSPSSYETTTHVVRHVVSPYSIETSTSVVDSGEALSQPKTNPLHSSSVISATSAQPTDHDEPEDCFGDRGVCHRNPQRGCYITLSYIYCVSSLISFVVLLSLFFITRKREDVLSAYNAASAAWPAAKKAFIDQVTDGFVNITGDGGSLLLLPYTDFTDNYPDKIGLNIPSSVFKFSAVEVSSAPISDKNVYMNNQFVTLSINVSGVVSSVPLKIFSNDGYSNMPRAMIHTNCFVINMNTKEVSGGCNYDKDRRISYSAWKPVPNASGPYTFTEVRFSLRSDQDPFVVALRATDGSLKTSVTYSEIYSRGVLVIVTGSPLFLLVICFFLLHGCHELLDCCFCGLCGKHLWLFHEDPQKGSCMTYGFIYCVLALVPGILFTFDHTIQSDFIVGLFFLITSVCLWTCQCLVLSREPPPPTDPYEKFLGRESRGGGGGSWGGGGGGDSGGGDSGGGGGGSWGGGGEGGGGGGGGGG